MASSRKSFLAKPSCIFAATSHTHSHPDSMDGVSEFDEAELWNLSSSANPVTEATREGDADAGGSVASSGSLPVNIPDWSRIYGKINRKRESVGVEDEETRIPPHEYLARTRGACFSGHQGRDLRSVRNAIWNKVGFED